MAVRVGGAEAINHEPNEICTPYCRAISAPSGLAAMAVNQRADDTVRLAIPENIRNRPRRWRSLPGSAPAARAMDSVRGYRTPERAVLLGKAGAISPSTRKML